MFRRHVWASRFECYVYLYFFLHHVALVQEASRFVEPIQQDTSFRPTSCHTLPIFVPMHTLAHNVQLILPVILASDFSYSDRSRTGPPVIDKYV